MVKEPLRKCSHCGQQGHNSRTCINHNVVSSGNRNGNNVNNFGNGNGKENGNIGNVGNGKGHSFKLFGVNIMEGAEDTMKKSRSMGNLADFSRGHGGGGGGNDVAACGDDDRDRDRDRDHEAGYLSDGVIHNVKRKAAHERKRGIPWTEEEHRTFLAGLSKLGKGDWRGISTKFVTTRTPTQVASHAQKYFVRQQAPKERKKRRSSVFDLPFTQSDDIAPQRHPVSSKTKPTAETSSKPIRSQVLAEKNSAEILNRFPHLCLDNYPAPVRPGVAAPNYLVPYGVGFPGNVQPWPMINIAGPSYLYNVPNVYGGVDNYVPVVITHPSGIPPPRTPPSSPLAKKVDVGALSSDQTDCLELNIEQPQSKRGELSSSPASEAIRVT